MNIRRMLSIRRPSIRWRQATRYLYVATHFNSTLSESSLLWTVVVVIPSSIVAFIIDGRKLNEDVPFHRFLFFLHSSWFTPRFCFLCCSPFPPHNAGAILDSITNWPWFWLGLEWGWAGLKWAITNKSVGQFIDERERWGNSAASWGKFVGCSIK